MKCDDQAPSLVHNITEAFKQVELEMLNQSTRNVFGSEISKLFLIINMSFNCTIFYIFSKKFRDDFHKALKIRKANTIKT